MKLFVYDLLFHPPHSLKTVLCTLYILIGGSSVAFADVNTATVHSEMLRMPAKERLVYLRNACDNAIGKDDEKQYDLLKIYIAEAQKQASTVDEMYGLKRLMCYYYNYDKPQFRSVFPCEAILYVEMSFWGSICCYEVFRGFLGLAEA